MPAFELACALDYLMKPVGSRPASSGPSSASCAWPTATRRRPRCRRSTTSYRSPGPRGGATRLLHRAEILYLQSEGDYVRVVADSGRFLVRARLGDLEERWSDRGFARVHRGYVANLQRAVEVRPSLDGHACLRLADGSELPIARRQLPGLRRRLGV